MRVGATSPVVPSLRQRLILTGDLDPAVGISPVYDSYVEAGVRRFQARHGLNTTGALNASTIAAMNVPAEIRLRQLELNVVRLRAYSGNLGHRYVIVNIPAAVVETVEEGRVASRHAAGVGKIDRQSPVMNAKITEVNFNPFWTVPASIIKKDLIPKMQKEPNYLTENKIRIYSPKGEEIAPQRVNWHSDEATRYMFRQDPGADLNSMGFVRINIPNPHGVYMHDTPSKGIFGDDFRFVSSGCVRVQNVRDYITWLLKDTPGWSRDQIDQTIEGGQRIDAKLAQPVNVYWTYITAWATPEGARAVPRRHLQPRRPRLDPGRAGGRQGAGRAGQLIVPPARCEKARHRRAFPFSGWAAYCVRRRVPMLFAIVWKASISPLASFATKVRSAEPAQSARRFRPC